MFVKTFVKVKVEMQSKAIFWVQTLAWWLLSQKIDLQIKWRQVVIKFTQPCSPQHFFFLEQIFKVLAENPILPASHSCAYQHIANALMHSQDSEKEEKNEKK